MSRSAEAVPDGMRSNMAPKKLVYDVVIATSCRVRFCLHLAVSSYKHKKARSGPESVRAEVFHRELISSKFLHVSVFAIIIIGIL